MAIHNADFDFFTDASDDDRKAFLGHPVRTLLKPQEKLYRFITPMNLPFQGNGMFENPWWFSAETFRRITMQSTKTAQPLTDVARHGLAIAQQFNPSMECFMVIQLKAPAYGWTGRARRQRTHPGSGAWFDGGFEQLYIPDLADGGDGTSSPFAYIYSFTSFDGT